MTRTTRHPLVERIADALAAGDRAALAGLYAADAEYTSVGGSHPPAAPLRLTGEAIGEYVGGIPADIRMTLDHALVGADGRIAFTTTCDFPGGGQSVTAHLIALDGMGRIAAHRAVEAVDG